MSGNVKAKLNYSRSVNGAAGEKWFIDTVSSPDGLTISNFENEEHTVNLQDIRGRERDFTLDQCGFEGLLSPTAVDPGVLLKGGEELKVNYYPELEKLISTVTGCDAVVFFDHTIRQSSLVRDESSLHRLPVFRVHVDQNPVAAHARVQLHAHQHSTCRRFQILNVWRPIANIVYDYPLALADFRSLNLNSDLVSTDLRFPPWLKDKETFSVQFNPHHRWYYWSEMRPDEVLMLKCYDSASRQLGSSIHGISVDRDAMQVEDISGLCPHTAFLHERGIGHLGRQSIEVRALVFYN